MERIGLYDTFDVDREDMKAICLSLIDLDVTDLTKPEYKIYVVMRRKGLLTKEGDIIKMNVTWE